MAAALERVRSYASLAAGSLLRVGVVGNPMARLVFLREIYFTAVSSMRLIFVAALVFGTAFIGQATHLMRDDTRLYELIELLLVRNIAPLIAAAVIVGRSATAMSTELALMRVTGEIETLRRMRVPVRDYLVVPRVAAVTLATVGCCFFCQLIAVLGGFAVSSLFLDVQFAEQLGRFAERMSIEGYALDVVKSACFGVTIASVACGVGLGVAPRMEEVPLAPARAFLAAMVGVIAVDVLFLTLSI